MVAWLERHQVALYLVALLLGGLLGLGFPGVAGPAETAINPVLGLLLYATFLAVPFGKLRSAMADWRFLLTVLLLNFLLVPMVVWVLSRFVAGDQVLLLGVLFVLLAPCIDYVIVFTGLAGGAQDRLLAATPILMLLQMLLLPLFLWAFAGPSVVETVEWEPFFSAFLWLILVPLLAAGLTQLAAARSHAGHVWSGWVAAAMVPLMMLTLAVVVASQIYGVSQQLGQLLWVIPIYIAFALVMVMIGLVVGRLARLDIRGRRAMIFSGVTRNSLVVLPLVLALPAGFELAALVVVTQTLVELVIMVALVRLVPRLLPLAVSGNPRNLE
ncbi:arsenic resistance protein [Corynebacterium sp. A21]|uniref:arsenic resistance protein n=1 Tax=Corynebacterium sp. A21 TaxID=3457318 RepID=UPI003FD3A81E